MNIRDNHGDLCDDDAGEVTFGGDLQTETEKAELVAEAPIEYDSDYRLDKVLEELDDVMDRDDESDGETDDSSFISVGSFLASTMRERATSGESLPANERSHWIQTNETVPEAGLITHLALSTRDRSTNNLNLLLQMEAWHRLIISMMRSCASQEMLQEHDRQQGLPRSHAYTMVHSNISRRQLIEGRLLRRDPSDAEEKKRRRKRRKGEETGDT